MSSGEIRLLSRKLHGWYIILEGPKVYVSILLNQLLTTKLYVPPLRATLTPRSRLVQQLEKALPRTPLIAAPADWHPYSPNAERDARIEAEGLNTESIQKFGKLDEGEDESLSPDFDL